MLHHSSCSIMVISGLMKKNLTISDVTEMTVTELISNVDY